MPFRPGARILASKLKLRIQPVVLINTRKLYNTSPLSIETNKARVVLMEAFTPDFDDENWYKKLEMSMQEVYLKHYRELNKRDLSNNLAQS